MRRLHSNPPKGTAVCLLQAERRVSFRWLARPSPPARVRTRPVRKRQRTQRGILLQEVRATIDAYAYNGGCLPGQRGQAKVYLGSWPVTVAAGAARGTFSFEVQVPSIAASEALAVTATDESGNTSELGECFPVDRIFKDGYQ
jgi:hypothetical protein